MLIDELMSQDEKAKWKALFAEEVHARAEEIDPSSEHDWHSLTIGWAIAKGIEPETAFAFATYIRYHTDLG